MISLADVVIAAFADDAESLFTPTLEALQANSDILNKFFLMFNLRINTSKTNQF